LGASIKTGFNFHLTKNIYGFIEAGISAPYNTTFFSNIGTSYFFGKYKASDGEKKKIKIHFMHPMNLFFYSGIGLGGNAGTNYVGISPNSNIRGNDSVYSWIIATKTKELPGFSFSIGINLDILRIGKAYINAGIEYREIDYRGTVLESQTTTTIYSNSTTTVSTNPVKYFL